MGDEVEGKVVELRPNSVGLDLGGGRGRVSARSLGLRGGEVGKGPYRVGDRLRVSVEGVNPGGSFNCKPVGNARRRAGAAPSAGSSRPARDALRQSSIKVGDEVEGKVVELRPNSLRLNINGRKGWVSAERLGLAAGEVQKGPFRAGDQLRVRVRGTVGSGEDVDCELLIKVGDEVEGEVVELRPSSVGLDLRGSRGWVSGKDLGLREGGVEKGPYSVGNRLRVSVASINPGGSFNCKPIGHIKVGAVVPVRVEAQADGDGLKVSVNGLPAVIAPDELVQCANDLMPDLLKPGDIIAAFVLAFDGTNLQLELSLRRAPTSWVDVLAQFEGTVVDARIVSATTGGLNVDVGGVPGWIVRSQLLLSAGQDVKAHFRAGDFVRALVSGIDERRRRVLLSVSELWAAAEIEVGTVVPARVEAQADGDGLRVSVNGLSVVIPPDELVQCANDLMPDLLKPGDIIAAFVLAFDGDKQRIELSLRRAPTSWVDALARLEGTTVDARIVSAMGRGLIVDADGMPGWIVRSELLLSAGQNVKAYFQTGRSVRALVSGIDGRRRQALLSAAELWKLWEAATAEIEVGTVVLARVEAHANDDGLRVSVNGQPVVIPPDELVQCANDLAPDLLEPGDIVAAFVLAVDRTKQQLDLSLQRAAPARVNMLRSLGEVLRKLSENEEPPIVPGSVLEIDTKSMSMLVSVNGITSWIPKIELPSGTTTTSLESYVGGSPVDVYVREVDLDRRDIALSMRRVDPEWRAALDSLVPEQAVSGTIALADRTRGLAIDLGPVAAWVAWSDVPRSEGQYRNWIRRVGQTVFGHVKSTGDDEGDVHVTLIQASAAAADLLSEGDVVVGEITGFFKNQPGVHIAVGPVRGGAARRGLPLRSRDAPELGYAVGDIVSVEVTEITADDWIWFSIAKGLRRENASRFRIGETMRCVVDEITEQGGWVTAKGMSGFISREELTCTVGDPLEDYVVAGDVIDAMVVGHDDSDHTPFFSARRLDPTWPDRVADLYEGQVVRGEVASSDSQFALVDIGPVSGRVGLDEQTLSLDGEMSLRVRDKVEVVVTRIHPEHVETGVPLKVDLSVRRADPGWSDAVDAIAVNEVVDGVVTGVSDYAVFVDIGPISGKCLRSEVPVPQTKPLSRSYRHGQRVHVWVLWVDADKPVAGLSIRRAELREPGTQHSKPPVGERFDAKCVELNDLYAAFSIEELPGWEGIVRSDEWSLQATDVAEFTEGDVVPVVVLGIDKVKAKRVDLSVRRAREGWRAACEGLLSGQSVQGIIADVRSGGIRVDVGPLTDWVSDADATLEAGGRANETYSRGQRIDVYIVEVWDLKTGNPRLRLSARRAMDDWYKLVRRIKPGSLLVGQVLPKVAQTVGFIRLDLGPIDGVISPAEVDDAEQQAREFAWGRVKVVVEEFGITDIEAIVSLDRYGDRWAELAKELHEGEIVQADYLRHDESAVDADLGAGLIVRVSTTEWKTVAARTGQELESYTVGDPIDVRIVSIDHENQTITGSLRPGPTEAQQRVAELLQGRESKRVEFKPGLRKLENADRDMEFEVLKNVVAFLNAEGGDLLIGVTDAGQPTGLRRDDWQDIDAAQRHLEQRISTRIGGDSWNYIRSECVQYDDLDLLLVTISPLPRESRLARLVVGGEEKIFARQGSSAQPLEGNEAADYQIARATGTDYEIPDSDGPTGTQ